MRKRSLDMVHALARRDDRVVFIGSDLSPNLLGEMKREFPQRYYMEGIAEANVIGMAAGMAMDGFIPYVNTIATFITRRCYEQVAVDLCLHDLPVRLIGNGGGYVYAPLGPTHQAIEKFMLIRSTPNILLLRPADGNETAAAWKVAVRSEAGPIGLVLQGQQRPDVQAADARMGEVGGEGAVLGENRLERADELRQLARIDGLDTGMRGGPDPAAVTLGAFGRDIPEA